MMCAGPVVASDLHYHGRPRPMWDLAAISAAAHTGRIMEDRDRERERESDTHTHRGRDGGEGDDRRQVPAHIQREARRVASRVGGVGVATVARVVASRAH